jgi:hypothetical protein
MGRIEEAARWLKTGVSPACCEWLDDTLESQYFRALQPSPHNFLKTYTQVIHRSTYPKECIDQLLKKRPK